MLSLGSATAGEKQVSLTHSLSLSLTPNPSGSLGESNGFLALGCGVLL